MRPSPSTITVALALAIATSPSARATPGQLDPTFSGDGIATAFTLGSVATAVAVDDSGRTVVVGYTTDSHVDVAVARFRRDGTLDPSFNGSGRIRMPLGADTAWAFDVAVADDDGLAIAGRLMLGGMEDSFVLRLGPDGEPVGAFGADGLAIVDLGKKQESANAVSFTPQGRIDLGGYVSNGTSVRCAFARLNTNGTPDASFSGDGRAFVDLSAGAEQVNDLVVLPHGDIIAAGYADHATQPRFAIFRIGGNGKLATAFGHDGATRTDLGPGADVANAITPTASGYVLAGSAGNGGHLDWGVVRYLSDGSPDPTFGEGGEVILSWSAAPESADDVVVDGGKIVLAGRIHRAGTGDDAAVVRLRSGGKLDPTFASGGVARVDVAGSVDAAHGVAMLANGKIVVAGETWKAGVPRFLVARLKAA